MIKPDLKKEAKNFLFLFIAIFIGVFSIVSILETYRTFKMDMEIISYQQTKYHNITHKKEIDDKEKCLPSAKENSILQAESYNMKHRPIVKMTLIKQF